MSNDLWNWFADLVLEFLYPPFIQQDHRILHMNIGYPGSVNDARVLVNTDLYTNSAQLMGGPSIDMNEVDVPLMLVGDAGYPRLPWMLTPYPERRLTPMQAAFQFKHSSTRMCVEQVNGDVKDVQRYLHGKIQKPNSRKLPIIVAACCILHNMRLDFGDSMEEELLADQDGHVLVFEEAEGPGGVNVGHGTVDFQRTTAIRDAVAAYIYDE
jgi:hypothetical protein